MMKHSTRDSAEELLTLELPFKGKSLQDTRRCPSLCMDERLWDSFRHLGDFESRP